MSERDIPEDASGAANASSSKRKSESVAKRAQSQKLSSNIKSSPTSYVYSRASKRTHDSCDPEKENKRNDRREALVKQMHQIKSVDFDLFLRELGLEQKFNRFAADAESKLDYASLCRPYVIKEQVKLEEMENPDDCYLEYAKAIDGVSNQEERLVNCFIVLLEAIGDKAEESGFPNSRYGYIDCQKNAVRGSTHRPDIAVYCVNDTTRRFDAIHMVVEAKTRSFPNNISRDNIGQIADYVYSLWKVQITRKFVPVIFLHGASLSLLVFFRTKTIRVDLGEAFFENEMPNDFEIQRINIVLARLHFLLTLSPAEFGHICDFTEKPDQLCFSSGSATSSTEVGISDHLQESALAMVKADPFEGSDVFNLGQTFDRRISLRGRIAYTVKGTFKGEEAVLKLSWTSIERLPENAAYDILAKSRVEGVPSRLGKGLIFANFMGYRLEYMVLEDCGEPLSQALKRLHQIDRLGRFPGYVVSIIKQVAACLVNAYVEGIVHRDISDGNIAVRRLSTNAIDARVIDWGYSKDTMFESDRSAKVARLWHYDSKQVGNNEMAHDPFTGTPRYMGISTLFGSTFRNVVTDIESLFYVVLDALRTIYTLPNSEEGPVGFIHHERLDVLGHIRVSCIRFDDNWLADFGILKAYVPGELLRVLQAMRQFLFFNDGTYIGTDLARNRQYIYTVDEASARVFMDEKTIDILKGKDRRTGGPLTSTTTKDSPTKPTRTRRKRKTPDQQEASGS
ncbi:hypothetical protein GGF39_003495, partial [Coemansia sp. RSA 1721]